MDYLRVNTTCRICGNKGLVEIVDLGRVPLANTLVNGGYVNLNKYPIKVMFCPDCSLIQLNVVVAPEVLYTDYCYHSSISETFKRHCYELGKTLMDMIDVAKPYAVDIASNDGCLLEQFKSVGFSIMGVEPSHNLAKVAKRNGITTINEFWSKDIILPRKADCITATNVFAHVDDLDSFVEGVKLNLADGGIFVIEVPWAFNMIANNQFDTIYHEHLSYFLLKPIIRQLAKYDLTVFMADEVDIHGGSLRVYATNNTDKHPISCSVNAIIDKETKSGLYDKTAYKLFRDNIESAKDEFRKMLNDLKHKKIAGYCASAKGISLINYCGLDNSIIKMICDETPYKVGKKIPESNIPIVGIDELKKFNPDFIILFSWNFSTELKKKLSCWFKGFYIIPIPYARVE